MIPGSANPLLLKSAAAAGGLQISRSLRFNSSDSAYLSRTPASAGNRKTWTWSGWVKRSALGSNAGNAEQYIFRGGTDGSSSQGAIIIGSDTLYYIDNYSTYPLYIQTTQVLRDPSAWYHILVAIDTTQATSSNRGKLYINGTQVTSLATAIYPSQNYDTFINSAASHTIGRRDSSFPRYFSGYLANIHFIDGQALTPSSFTETDATTGQLIPKTYTGSYGTNGYNLLFADNSSNTASTLGKDTSGNSNNWTPNNLSVTAGAGNDSLVDSPTNYGTDTGVGGEVRGNYATLNNLLNTNGTYANGNLEKTQSDNFGAISTICPSSGKWYAEFAYTAIGSASAGVIVTNLISASGANGLTQTWQLGYTKTGKLETAGSQSNVTGFTTNDVIGVAFDCATGAATFYKNGSSIGTATSSAFISVPVGIGSATGGSIGSNTVVANYGQRAFAYTAPSGFKALCTQNLPAPLVTKSNTVMDVALYTGNGGTQSITGLAFSPDLLWIKARSAGYSHLLADSVRGPLYTLQSDGTSAEQSYGCINSFDSAGFTVDLDGTIGANNNGTTFVGWAWDAGTSTVSNTQGSITSQVRANATAGFSVVGWNYPIGSPVSTIGHGLGVKPAFIIIKTRDNSSNWIIYHTSTGATKCFRFTTVAASTETDPFNNTEPTSSVFTIGAGSWWGGGNMIAYCFAPVVGYSNRFSYTGNGLADGSFVYLGFRPRLIILKRSDSTSNWTLLDTSREGYNVDNDPLYPNLVTAEPTTDLLDITSNGFKLRTTDASVNASAGTYIGFAWAEMPFNYSRAR